MQQIKTNQTSGNNFPKTRVENFLVTSKNKSCTTSIVSDFKNHPVGYWNLICFSSETRSLPDTWRCSWDPAEVSHTETGKAGKSEKERKKNLLHSSISHLFSFRGAHLLTCFVKCYGVFPPQWLRRRLQRWDFWCRHGSYLQDRGLWRGGKASEGSSVNGSVVFTTQRKRERRKLMVF